MTKNISVIIVLQFIFISSVFLIFNGLHNQTLYNNTLGLISKNYQNINGERQMVKKPFDEINNDNFFQWDAKHYKLISVFGYDTSKAGSDYIFAFFPMFPLLLKFIPESYSAVLGLNFILFSVSIIFLCFIFSSKKERFENLALCLSLPSIIIFLIPYSEATFSFFVAIGIFGYVKKRYTLYFVGLFCAALTRPSYTFLVISILCLEFLQLLKYKVELNFLKQTVMKIIPLLLGTLVVILFQNTFEGSTPLKFIEVQEYWGNKLRVPGSFKDWSHEGFAINIGVLFFVFIPLIVLLFKRYILSFSDTILEIRNNRMAYLVDLSAVYIFGSTLFILMFRGGSLHCLFRFTLCTPFFFILLFSRHLMLRQLTKGQKVGSYIFGLVLGALVLTLCGYSSKWDFLDLGFVILSFWFGLIYLGQFILDKYKKGLLCVLFFVNVVWTAYLLNSYINNSWIFA